MMRKNKNAVNLIEGDRYREYFCMRRVREKFRHFIIVSAGKRFLLPEPILSGVPVPTTPYSSQARQCTTEI